jgi:hypothetical protein
MEMAADQSEEEEEEMLITRKIPTIIQVNEPKWSTTESDSDEEEEFEEEEESDYEFRAITRDENVQFMYDFAVLTYSMYLIMNLWRTMILKY